MPSIMIGRDLDPDLLAHMKAIRAGADENRTPRFGPALARLDPCNELSVSSHPPCGIMDNPR